MLPSACEYSSNCPLERQKKVSVDITKNLIHVDFKCSHGKKQTQSIRAEKGLTLRSSGIGSTSIRSVREKTLTTQPYKNPTYSIRCSSVFHPKVCHLVNLLTWLNFTPPQHNNYFWIIGIWNIPLNIQWNMKIHKKEYSKQKNDHNKKMIFLEYGIFEE